MTSLSYEERSIEKEVFIAADRERVFRALTEVDELRGWLVTDGEVSAVPGGRLTLQWEGGETAYITIAELIPNERVVMEWYDPDDVGATLAAFDLIADDERKGTLLRLRESGYGDGDEWDRAYAEADEGWDDALADLRAYLEGSNP